MAHEKSIYSAFKGISDLLNPLHMQARESNLGTNNLFGANPSRYDPVPGVGTVFA